MVEKAVQEILSLFESSRTLEANRKYQRLLHDFPEFCESDLYKLHQVAFATMQNDVNDVNVLYDNLYNEDWEEIFSKEGKTYYFKKEDDSPCYQVKIVAEMDCSLVAFLVIAAKLNKLPEMIPLISSVFIPYDTMYKKLVYGTVDNWPFPLNMFLSYRDCFLYTFGIDDLEKGEIIICCHSVTENEFIYFDEASEKGTNETHQKHESQHGPDGFIDGNDLDKMIDTFYLKDEKRPKYVRATVEYGGIVVHPLSPTRVKVEMMSKFDPKIAFLPKSIVNFAIKQIIHLNYKKIESILCSEEFKTAITTDERFADYRQRERDYFDDNEEKL